MARQLLTSMDAVITALGGYADVRQITNSGANAVYNWKRRGRFPQRTYDAMQEALADLGFRGDPSLWRMTPAPSKKRGRK